MNHAVLRDHPSPFLHLTFDATLETKIYLIQELFPLNDKDNENMPEIILP